MWRRAGMLASSPCQMIYLNPDLQSTSRDFSLSSSSTPFKSQRSSCPKITKVENHKRFLISPLTLQIVYISIISRVARSRRFLKAFEFSPLSPAREEVLVEILRKRRKDIFRT